MQCKLGIFNAIVVVTSQTHEEKDKRLSEPCRIVNSDDATTLRIYSLFNVYYNIIIISIDIFLYILFYIL